MNSLLNLICVMLLIAIYPDGAAAQDDLTKTRLYQLKSFQACNKCDLSGADLSGAILHQSNLRESILTGADLRWFISMA